MKDSGSDRLMNQCKGVLHTSVRNISGAYAVQPYEKINVSAPLSNEG